jgi:RNA recognition motif-containing protein
LFFSRFGDVIDIVFPMDKDRQNKGYAFVSFSSKEAIKAISNNLQNIVLRAKLVG